MIKVLAIVLIGLLFIEQAIARPIRAHVGRPFLDSSSSGPPPSGDWILTTGFWADSGTWDDNAVWMD